MDLAEILQAVLKLGLFILSQNADINWHTILYLDGALFAVCARGLHDLIFWAIFLIRHLKLKCIPKISFLGTLEVVKFS